MTHTFGDEPMKAPEGWSVVEQCLMCEFEFENFAEAKSFVDDVSTLCEQRTIMQTFTLDGDTS